MAKAVDDYSDIREAENYDSLTEQFEEAANHVKNIISGLDQVVVLQLYSYYKQATEGTCSIPQPRFYQAKARAKWDAWHKLGKMSKEEAKECYIRMITQLDPNFNKTDKADSWVAVSCLQNTEKELSESEKTIFDFVKDGDLEKLVAYIKNNVIQKIISEQDENGMGLIHWAADRGHADILKYLIEQGVDVNMTENDGQTALHYAVSCEHLNCVKLLVEAGANTQFPDTDGIIPSDLSTNADILNVLNE